MVRARTGREPASHAVHAVVIWPFVEAVRRLGFEPQDPRALLRELVGAADRELGIEPNREPSRNPERESVSHAHASLLLDWAVALTGRVDLGLLAAEAVEPGHFELVELAARTQGTVGDGLLTLASLAPILHEGLSVKLERGEGTSLLRIRLDEGLSMHPASYDFIVASLVIGGRRQTGVADMNPLFVRLPYALPSQLQRVSDHPLLRLVQCDLSVGSDALEIGFPTAALDVPLMRANASMGEVLKQAARELLPQEAAPSALTTAVQKVVREGLAGDALDTAKVLDTATVARKLHMSERTLRRKLEADGASLRGLIDDARRELALELVLDETRSTDEVATQLGFTTAQALHRAFRRWTGTTVQAFRTQQAGRSKRPAKPG